MAESRAPQSVSEAVWSAASSALLTGPGLLEPLREVEPTLRAAASRAPALAGLHGRVREVLEAPGLGEASERLLGLSAVGLAARSLSGAQPRAPEGPLRALPKRPRVHTDGDTAELDLVVRGLEGSHHGRGLVAHSAAEEGLASDLRLLCWWEALLAAHLGLARTEPQDAARLAHHAELATWALPLVLGRRSPVPERPVRFAQGTAADVRWLEAVEPASPRLYAEALEVALREGNAEVQAALLGHLCERDPPRAVERALAALRERGRTELVRAALEVLGRFSSPEALRGLVALLLEEELRDAAAQALLRCEGEEAEGALGQKLEELARALPLPPAPAQAPPGWRGLPRDAQEWLRRAQAAREEQARVYLAQAEVLCEVLVRRGRAPSLARLGALWRGHGFTPLRVLVGRALLRWPAPEEAAPLGEALLGDESATAREVAAALCLGGGAARAWAVLSPRLERGREGAVELAQAVLACAGREPSRWPWLRAEPWLGWLRAGLAEPRVQDECAAALGALGDAESAGAVHELLRARLAAAPGRVPEALLEALAALGDRRAGLLALELLVCSEVRAASHRRLALYGVLARLRDEGLALEVERFARGFRHDRTETERLVAVQRALRGA